MRVVEQMMPESGAAARSTTDAQLATDLAYVDAILGPHLTAKKVEVVPHRLGAAGLDGLNRLADRHHLTSFDRDLLLLAAAPYVSRQHASTLARADGAPCASVGFALDALGASGSLSRELMMSRLLPSAPLLGNALVELSGALPFTARRVHVPDLVWRRMLGIDSPPTGLLPPLARAQMSLAAAVDASIADTAAWSRLHDAAIIIRGHHGTGRSAIARAIATELKTHAIEVTAEMTSAEIVREARWHDAIPVMNGMRPDLDALLASCPLVIAIAEPSDEVPIGLAPRVFEIRTTKFDAKQRLAVWQRSLGDAADLEHVSRSFRLGPARIEAAASLAKREARRRGTGVSREDVLEACRALTPPTRHHLARELETDISLDDVVLTSRQLREIELAIAWSRHRPYERGPGLTCMFAGPSGTGKTTAARAVAQAIGGRLYRIDLAQVVSKYIGETEKNLDRLFEDAEETSSILFFDEADALFAKRTDVRDAHDRFANVETGYLLQRLESHGGVVILATNLRNNIDSAFARRIQVIVDFPLPSGSERESLWRLMLPADRDPVDTALLAARFAMTGGDIRNAVTTSIVLAAAEKTRVAMRHVIIGTWREFQRSGRLARGDEFNEWRRELAPWMASTT
jgi:SpoVK/Ycf46/Vps4 family AAA+-type ATPase